MAPTEKMMRVTMNGSFIRCTAKQRATLRGLGLTRRGRSVIVRDTASIRGMVRLVQHLVEVEA